MKIYEFKTEGIACAEPCKINPNIKIGAVSCRECQHCIIYDDSKKKIICERIDEATGVKTERQLIHNFEVVFTVPYSNEKTFGNKREEKDEPKKEQNKKLTPYILVYYDDIQNINDIDFFATLEELKEAAIKIKQSDDLIIVFAGKIGQEFSLIEEKTYELKEK